MFARMEEVGIDDGIVGVRTRLQVRDCYALLTRIEFLQLLLLNLS